jgi:hypothetical protein
MYGHTRKQAVRRLAGAEFEDGLRDLPWLLFDGEESYATTLELVLVVSFSQSETALEIIRDGRAAEIADLF